MAEDKNSFEEAISKLQEIVEKLEKGDLTLDESIEYFQEGIKLSKFCTKRLDEIEKKITVLIEGENGEVEEKAFAVNDNA